MKKIKMLLMCLMLAFFVGIPVNANVIEIDKPTEQKPKEILMDLSFSKPAYHLGEDVVLNLKLNDFPDEDVQKIDEIRVRVGSYIYCRFFPIDYNYTTKCFSKILSRVSSSKEGIEDISESANITVFKEIKDLTQYSFNPIKEKARTAFNDNCADGVHTVYKDDWKIEQEPFCWQEGKESRYCAICKQFIESRTIPKSTKHEKSTWIIERNPTIYKEGLKIIKCVECGKILQTQTIPIIKHDHVKSEWIITKNPTFYEEGVKVIKCKKCNKILQTQKITKLPSTTKLKFSKKSITIKKGKSVKLKYARKPVNAKDKLTWKSSKPKIVKILKNGKVKGLKKGRAVITLTTNTKKKAKITIKVK